MKRTSVDSSIAQDLFDSAKNAAAKGQAAFFTPPDVARALCRLLPRERPHIADLNCGDGALLDASAHQHPQREQIHLYGCDIANSNLGNSKLDDFSFTKADVTKFFPLLVDVDWRCPLFVLNPPWDLHWFRTLRSATVLADGVPAAGHDIADGAATLSASIGERAGVRCRSGLDCLLDSELESVRTAFAAHDGRTSHDTIDSTVATMMMALDRLTDDGEGLLIANHATMLRLLGDPATPRTPSSAVSTPHAALLDHVWLWLVFDGNICMEAPARAGNWEGGTSAQTAILYFARDHTSGPRSLTPALIPSLTLALCSTLRRRREGAQPTTYSWYEHRDCAPLWLAAADEWQRRRKNRPDWNLWLAATGSGLSGLGSGVICTHLNLYEEKARRIDKATIARLHALNGKRPMDLVLMRAERDELMWACGLADGRATLPRSPDQTDSTAQPEPRPTPFKVHPELIAAVKQAILEYHAERAPLYPLPRIQRLGYLDEEDSIECIVGFPAAGGVAVRKDFKAGRRYPLKSETVTVTWKEYKPNLEGEDEELELTGQELVLSIQDEHGQWHKFVDARHLGSRVLGLASVAIPQTPDPIHHPLQLLVDHFDIPDVPDVAAVRPDEYQRHLVTLKQLEQLCP